MKKISFVVALLAVFSSFLAQADVGYLSFNGHNYAILNATSMKSTGPIAIDGQRVVLVDPRAVDDDSLFPGFMSRTTYYGLTAVAVTAALAGLYFNIGANFIQDHLPSSISGSLVETVTKDAVEKIVYSKAAYTFIPTALLLAQNWGRFAKRFILQY